MYRGFRVLSSPLLYGGLALAFECRKNRSRSTMEAKNETGVGIAATLVSGVEKRQTKINNLAIAAGTASTKLGMEIAADLGTRLDDVTIKKFSDGEIFCTYNESIRGRSLFVVQSCANENPVNENIMELLLLITAARRAGASKVTAVIPYFGYKYHKRGLPISTKHHSRFLWSAAGDFAKLLQVAGVDMIIAVDLQRPGQGHEACFFDSSIPVETISSLSLMASYFRDNVKFDNPVVVVAANASCMKKAISFRKELLSSSVHSNNESELAVFIHSLDPGSESEFLGMFLVHY